MTQRAVNQELTERPGLMGHGNGMVRILAAVAILAVVFLLAFNLRNEPASIAPSMSRQTFSTQQYWDLAKESKASRYAAPASRPATFTQQYWDLAKAHVAGIAPTSASTFSTQQYWDLAKESKASRYAAPASRPATFTQQYWDLAKAHQTREEAAEPEWATYTDRYWSLSR